MCGILAVYSKNTKYSLNKFIKQLSQLQHRGTDSYGIYFGNQLKHYNGNVDPNSAINDEESKIILGHVRYSTTKKTDNENINRQPLKRINPDLILIHNGNLPNFNKKMNTDSTDSQYILDYIYNQLREKTIENALISLLSKIPGVYSIIVLYNSALYSCRDRYGVRPLFYTDTTDHITFGSETVVFDQDNYIKEQLPGTIMKITDNIEYIYKYENIPLSVYCSFEIIYFMHHNSQIDDHSISELRYRLGSKLGSKELSPIKDAIVVAMPNTAIPGAEAFASTLSLPYYPYIQKNRGSTRTFILSTNEQRINACKRKFNYSDDLKGKTIYLVDDSIVRGNTLQTVIKQLKDHGVNQIHIRITSPPVISPCYYGIDIPTYEELIADKKTIQEICKSLGGDSLNYLSIDDLKSCLRRGVCVSCFSDEHEQQLLDW
jgi:amidophosphoribosyltransferase